MSQGTHTAASNALDDHLHFFNQSFNGNDTPCPSKLMTKTTSTSAVPRRLLFLYTLNVQYVNTPPVNNVPGSQSVNEAVALSSAAAGNGFSITDDASVTPVG